LGDYWLFEIFFSRLLQILRPSITLENGFLLRESYPIPLILPAIFLGTVVGCVFIHEIIEIPI
jgi:hypothetical protein